jgi:hypothetical protein
MILVQIQVERMNDKQNYHKIVSTKEEVQEVKDELEATKRSLYGSSGFVGYYSYYVEEVDIETVHYDEIQGLTLAEMKRLMDHAYSLELKDSRNESK